MKKRLLNEDVTRRFMKLANLGTLSENFVTETEAELEEAMHEDEMEEDMYEAEEEPMGDEPADDMPMGDEPEMDMDALEDELPAEEPEMDMGDDAAGGDLDASAVINAVAQATLDALKTQGLVSDETTVSVDGEDEMGDEPMPEPEPEMDMGGEEEADVMEAADETLEETTDETLEETVDEQEELTEDDAFVSEIVRRVAERILAAKKQS